MKVFNNRKNFIIVFLAIIIISISTALISTTWSGQIPGLNDHEDKPEKIVYLRAYQFGYTVDAIQEGSEIVEFPEGAKPSVLELDVGDRVTFMIISEDITHGFYIDGYTPPPGEQKLRILPGQIIEVGPITFDKVGKFKIRCSVTCGPLHPFMVSDIVVKPNIPYYVLLVSTVALGATVMLYLRTGPRNEMLGISLRRELDLFSIKGIGPVLRRMARWRGIQFALILPSLFIFSIILTAGFFGNPTGNKNFSTAVVWILWFALVEVMILFAGRFWCTICPLPVFGEWFARRRIVGVHRVRKWFSLGRRWPSSANNMWISAIGFLCISLIVLWLVTRPIVTGLLFLLLIITGIVVYLTYSRRQFCKHICPAGGYIGFHSNASIFSIRSKDNTVCSKHKGKECIRGGPNGYGCPWGLYPGKNSENTYCGQCLECFKSCPLDNMTMKVRMIGKDLAHKAARSKNKFDEAWMGFIRFTLAIFYEIVFFGPYSWLKDWGNLSVNYGANLATVGLLTPPPWGLFDWLKWALLVTAVSLAIYPAIFYSFSSLSKRFAGVKQSAEQLLVSFSYALAPYGLFIWIAFAVNLLMVFWAYPLTAFSDPFGWGWNLLGFKFEWTPIKPSWVLFVQAPLIFTGLALAINSTYNIAGEIFKDHKKAFRATLVMGTLHLLAALLLIWIIAG